MSALAATAAVFFALLIVGTCKLSECRVLLDAAKKDAAETADELWRAIDANAALADENDVTERRNRVLADAYTKAQANYITERAHRTLIALPELDRPESFGAGQGPSPIYDALVSEGGTVEVSA